MFRCNYCGTEFEIPDVVFHGEFLPGIGIRIDEDQVCPFCGSIDFEETEKTEDEEYGDEPED